MIGATLGHYRLLEQIGAGGAGLVFLARDEHLDRNVAIKVLSQRGQISDATRRKFRREALALSRTNHPNIATIHDFASQDGVDYLVMEYIPGRSLSEYVARSPLANEEAFALGCQLADGLAEAHATGVVHGDLKPGNVRITPDGRLKILDFGLARISVTGDATTEPITELVIGGTLPYMAPEQIRGQQPDMRSDVYSAGAVLYEMATGRRPFSASNHVALMNAILQGRPDPPTETNPHISPGLNAIVMKALDLDPALRYQSATELQVDLNRLSQHHVSPRPRPRPVWRVAAVLFAAAAAIGLSTAAWLLYGPSVRRATTESQRSSPTKPVAAPPATPSQLRVALTPVELIGATTEMREWPGLISGLLTSELASVPEISLLGRSELSGGGSQPGAGSAELEVRVRVLLAGPMRELHCSVIESAANEVAFSTRSTVEGEAQLPSAVRALSGALSAFFKARSNGPEFARDLRPWISSRTYKAEAVTAFVHGAMYVFRFQPGEPRRYFQRALEIDPTFVAPRIWRFPTFLAEGKGDAELAYLSTIESAASPFEQTMIAYVKAVAANNLAAQSRHIEVALQYAPGNRILVSQLASIYETQGDCRAVLGQLRPLVDSKWVYAPVYPQWARCSIQLGQTDDARRVLETSLDLVPPYPETYALLEGLATLRQDAQAAARYAHLLGARTKDLQGSRASQVDVVARSYNMIAQHAVRSGSWATAIELFNKSVTLDPTEPSYRDSLADALEKLGRMREASDQRQQAQALRKNAGPARR
jgi:serine/threonine protein kinase